MSNPQNYMQRVFSDWLRGAVESGEIELPEGVGANDIKVEFRPLTSFIDPRRNDSAHEQVGLP